MHTKGWHSGSHVDHDNHYGPVIWGGRGISATFDREAQEAFYERGQQERAKMAAAYAEQADQDAIGRAMNITEFLLARIAEDEARATYYGPLAMGTGRVLAECASKRAIIELAQKASEDEKEYDDYEWQGTVERSEPLTGDAILFALAAVYKGHPDYRQEWAE